MRKYTHCTTPLKGSSKRYSKHVDTKINPLNVNAYADHFRSRMRERKITLETVKNVESNGDKYYVFENDKLYTFYHLKGIVLVKIDDVFVTCMRVYQNLERILFKYDQFVFTEE